MVLNNNPNNGHDAQETLSKGASADDGSCALGCMQPHIELGSAVAGRTFGGMQSQIESIHANPCQGSPQDRGNGISKVFQQEIWLLVFLQNHQLKMVLRLCNLNWLAGVKKLNKR